jgi:hypothetical protein
VFLFLSLVPGPIRTLALDPTPGPGFGPGPASPVSRDLLDVQDGGCDCEVCKCADDDVLRVGMVDCWCRCWCGGWGSHSSKLPRGMYWIMVYLSTSVCCIEEKSWLAGR